jgi:LysR family transcriptional regulator for metE and metH
MARKGIEFRECVAVGSTSAICELVKLGQGVALLPDWVVYHVAPSPLLTTRPIQDLRLTRTWAFVSANWTLPGLPMRTFLRLCQRAVLGLPAVEAPAPAATVAVP